MHSGYKHLFVAQPYLSLSHLPPRDTRTHLARVAHLQMDRLISPRPRRAGVDPPFGGMAMLPPRLAASLSLAAERPASPSVVSMTVPKVWFAMHQRAWIDDSTK